MSDVQITYNGLQLSTLDTSGVKTLHTQGKYCEGNIEISYNKPSGSTTPVRYNDVMFFDYDGSVIASYSASDFASLTQLPPNPTHDGLISQGWNWSLEDAKAQILLSGFLDIGQMYITSDNKTRLYLTIDDILRTRIRFFWNQTVPNGVEIDWGDGSEKERHSGSGNKNVYHTYASTGDYVITLSLLNGCVLNLGNGASGSSVLYGQAGVSVYRNMLRRVELGIINASLNGSAFYNFTSLETITIPKGLTAIGNSAFYGCYSLRHITYPDTVSSIGTYANRYNYTMRSISLPKSISSMSANAMQGCSVINRIAVPMVTSITDYMLGSCSNALKIFVPDTVTNIGANAFNGCSGVAEYHFKSVVPPTLASDNVFTSIQSDCKIYVPNNSVSDYQSAWPTYANRIIGE